MNNAQITIENIETKDSKELFRLEESRLVRIIENLQAVQSSKEWGILRDEIFDGVVNSLEREIKNEAKSENPNPQKLTRLSGKLEWAEKYSDLSKLEHVYKSNLKNIRIKLYGENE